jgi:hypothetical protein
MNPGTSEENFNPSVTEAVSFVTSFTPGLVEFHNVVCPKAAVPKIKPAAATNL